MAAIPAAEQPTRESLEGYLPRHLPSEDLAWSDLYPELCAWLNDREQRRKQEEGQHPEIDPADLAGSINSGAFNYHR